MAFEQANGPLESMLRDVMNIAAGKAFNLDGAQFYLLQPAPDVPQSGFPARLPPRLQFQSGAR
jgi:hypothetical protein